MARSMSVTRNETDPVQYPQSVRNHLIEVVTSMPAGRCTPIVAVPILREDALKATIQINVEMQETSELLANPTDLRVTAYVVPWLAMERFEGSRDQFDRSWMGQPKIDSGSVVPFFELAAMGTHGANAVYKYLGLHGESTDERNTMYLEAYNKIWNFRAENRSPQITPRTRLQEDLAGAFWNHSRFQNVVPSFDEAVIDGQVPLDLVNPTVAIHGLGMTNKHATPITNLAVNEPGGSVVYAKGYDIASRQETITTGQVQMGINYNDATGRPDFWADLAEDGFRVSLANIEMARKTQAFARLRERYAGMDDEYLLDMVMSGVSVGDQWLKQPILVADEFTRFGQAKRYATDSANLAKSAVSGGAAVRLNIRVPKLDVGGVLMVIAEAVPTQMWERQQDPFFAATNTRDGVELADLPDALRDFLDPQKVDLVKNKDIDSKHASPTGTFGYVPMNWKWNSFGPRVGGKFYRPTSGTNAARERFWAVEVDNPVLSTDFYVVSTIPMTPFLDEASDPFEVTAAGLAQLKGNTQFGGVLIEASDNYEEVMEKVPTTQITQP